MIFASATLLLAILWLFIIVFKVIEQQDNLHGIINIRDNIQGLQTALIDVQTSQRVFLLTDNNLSLDGFNEGKEKAFHFEANILASVQNFPDLKLKFNSIDPIVTQTINMVEKSIQLQAKGDKTNSRPLLSAGSANIYDLRDKLMDIDEALSKKSQSIAFELKQNLYRALMGSVIVLIGISLILYFGYRRTLQLFEEAIETRRLAEELNHQATHDALTKLPNRRNFDQSLRRVLSLSKRNRNIFGLMYMDLDGFKAINDKHGHDVGDAVLCDVSKRLLNCLRESEILARIGGDEFALIVQDFDDINVLNFVANRIIKAIEPPIEIHGKKLQVGISIGIAHYPENGTSVEEIIAASDSAMYNSKRTGKNKASFVT